MPLETALECGSRCVTQGSKPHGPLMSKIDIQLVYGYARKISIFERRRGGLAMDQMNVSITDRLAGYVRKQVKGGRYNNASEVVREALRRMEDDDARAVRLARPTAEDVLSDLTEEQLQGIRQRVRAGIESSERGEYVAYEGRDGLKKLAYEVKARGRKLLAQKVSGR
jgi:antitoxin ParD1/3/4